LEYLRGDLEMNNADLPAGTVSLEVSNRYEEGYYDQAALGLTKREELSARFVAGLLANSGGVIQANSQSGWGLVNCDIEQVAAFADQMALALIAQWEYVK
jgi:hypothetical protein